MLLTELARGMWTTLRTMFEKPVTHPTVAHGAHSAPDIGIGQRVSDIASAPSHAPIPIGGVPVVGADLGGQLFDKPLRWAGRARRRDINPVGIVREGGRRRLEGEPNYDVAIGPAVGSLHLANLEGRI